MRPFPDPAMKIAGSFFARRHAGGIKVTVSQPFRLRRHAIGA
jgi:hypothetical protein